MPHKSHGTHKSSQQSKRAKKMPQGAPELTDQRFTKTPRDYAKVGPTSIEGVEASDLPDKGRGPVETDPGKELKRKLPRQTGAIGEGIDVGLRGTPDVADAEEHGGRGANWGGSDR